MNDKVLEWALAHHGDGFLDDLMFFISRVGKGGFIFWFLAVGLALWYFFRRKPKRALYSLGYFVALGFTFVLVDFIIKPIAAEARPLVAHPEIITYMTAHGYKAPTDYSFPSGHSAAAFLAVSYFMMVDKRTLIGTVPLAFAIGFSRIFIGAHYLGDVLFGAGIGLFLGIILLGLARLAVGFIKLKNPEETEPADETR